MIISSTAYFQSSTPYFQSSSTHLIIGAAVYHRQLEYTIIYVFFALKYGVIFYRTYTELINE